MAPGDGPKIGTVGGQATGSAGAAVAPSTPHDGAIPEPAAVAGTAPNPEDTQLSPDLHQRALDLVRASPGLGPVPAVARPKIADSVASETHHAPRTQEDIASDAMIKAGWTVEQVVDTMEYITKISGSCASYSFEKLPLVVSAMKDAHWTSAQMVDTVKFIVEAGSFSADRIFENLSEAISAMRSTYWTRGEILYEVKFFMVGPGRTTLEVFGAIASMVKAGWTRKQMRDCIKYIVGNTPDTTIFAVFCKLALFISAMSDAHWTSDQMVDTVKSIVGSRSGDVFNTFERLSIVIPAMYDAYWTNDQMANTVNLIVEDGTLSNPRVIEQLPSVLKYVSTYEEFMTKLVGSGTLAAALLLSGRSPDAFTNKFRELQSQGAFNEHFVVLLADVLGIEGDYSFLRDIVKLPNYKQTARRWFELKDILTRGDSERLHAKVLQSLGAKFPNEKPGYYEELIHALAILDPSEAEIFSGEYLAETRVPSQQGAATRAAFLDAARVLGISDERHPMYNRYKSLLDKLAGVDGDIIFAVLGKRGFAKTCDKYGAEAADDAKKKKEYAKKLLNALERATQSSKLNHIANRLYDIAEEGMIKRLQKVADEGQRQALGQLQAKEPLWKKIKSSELWPLFIKSSHFMTDAGRKSLLKLMLGLELNNHGRLVYPKYEELEGVLGDDFLKQWREEYRKDFKPSDLKALDGAEGERSLKAQVIAQVGEHAGQAQVSTEKVSDQIQDLPKKVNDWVRRFGESASLNGEYLEEARGLLLVFEQHYFDIRRTYGDEFANIRTDLRNFAGGRERGVVVAKRSESFEVTGDVTKVALSGNRPVFTCQNMEFAWVNQEGQPVHRLIHGQFKVANWEVDGEVVARRLVEVTIDESGQEHLLIERLYTQGGFARVADFRAQIVEYARGLGIGESRVHFNDEPSEKSAPKPLKSADKIYRDTFRDEGMTLEEAKAMKAKRDVAVERERPKDDGEARRARPRRDSNRTTAPHRRSQTGPVILPEPAVRAAKSVRERFPAVAETADAFITRIERLMAAFRGNPEEAAKKVSRTLARDALSMTGKDRERIIAASFVLGFGKAGLEFLLADAGKTVFEDGFAGLAEVASKLGGMGETHAWMYFGGAATGGTVDAVMKSVPRLKALSPAMNMLIKPWLGLVVGSALDEFAKTGRIDLLAQAKTAVQFKVAGLLVMPLRMAAKVAGATSGLAGVLANAAFLAVELVMVKFYNETMGKIDPALDVIRSANLFTGLIGKDTDISGAAETLGGSLCVYAQTEGLFGEIAELDIATTEGGKVTIPYAGERRGKSVLDSGFGLIGYHPDEYEPKERKFAFGEKTRAEAGEATAEGLAVYTGSDSGRDGGTVGEKDSFVVEKSAELQRIMTDERLQVVETRIETLELMKISLVRRMGAGKISKLKYELDSFAVDRELSLAGAERDFLQELKSEDVQTEGVYAALEVFRMALSALRADWSKKEEELIARLIPENSEWIDEFFAKVSRNHKIIRWDGVRSAQLSNYAEAVSKSFPTEPEKLYLLGRVLERRYAARNGDEERSAPAPVVAATG